VTFLSPTALFFALSALLPLAAFAVQQWRARRAAAEIGEQAPRLVRAAVDTLSLAAVPALLALAIAQPVHERAKSRIERRGVEAYVVLDISGSMAASASPSTPTRLERAAGEALALRRLFPAIRFGIATITDRTLPVVFATSNPGVFSLAIQQSIGIERPPPSVDSFRASSLESLTNLAMSGFYTAPRRVAVVFTDGEADPLLLASAREFVRQHIAIFFVHVGRPGEHIFAGRVADPNYKSGPGGFANLQRMAAITHGLAFDESDFQDLVNAVSARLAAKGITKTARAQDLQQIPLAKWFVLGALAPLAFLLWRRNVPLELLRRGRAVA
jgi:hypothetical protein